MRYGNISCECGQSFYFETEMDSIRCLNCQKKFDVSQFPNKEDVNTTTLETGTGKVIDWDIDIDSLV